MSAVGHLKGSVEGIKTNWKTSAGGGVLLAGGAFTLLGAWFAPKLLKIGDRARKWQVVAAGLGSLSTLSGVFLFGRASSVTGNLAKEDRLGTDSVETDSGKSYPVDTDTAETDSRIPRTRRERITDTVEPEKVRKGRPGHGQPICSADQLLRALGYKVKADSLPRANLQSKENARQVSYNDQGYVYSATWPVMNRRASFGQDCAIGKDRKGRQVLMIMELGGRSYYDGPAIFSQREAKKDSVWVQPTERGLKHKDLAPRPDGTLVRLVSKTRVPPPPPVESESDIEE